MKPSKIEGGDEEQDQSLRNSPFLGLLLLGIDSTIIVLAAQILNQKLTKQDSKYNLGRCSTVKCPPIVFVPNWTGLTSP